MENPPSPSDSIPPELQVWVDAEIPLHGRTTPVDHQKMESALAHLPGVQSVSFVEDRVAIRYDPEIVTAAQLRERMRQAGFPVSEIASAAADPVVDVGGQGESASNPGS